MANKLFFWMKSYPELSLDGDQVFCKPCGKVISSSRKYLIDQHCGTPLHKRNCDKQKNAKMSQVSIGASLSMNLGKNEEESFKFDLCKALIGSNIALNKLNNPCFRNFLEKYSKKSIPDESTIRKNYVGVCYTETMQEVRQYLKNEYIYFIVDETTDVCGRYIANLLVGILSENAPSKSFLIATKELPKTNNLTISRFIQEGLNNVFLPEAVPMDRIVLMLTDAAAYMVKSGTNLKIFYPNLIHCTCLAHGVNRVAEEIIEQFPLVNDLINNVKKVFLKAPIRIQLYKEKLPNIPLPPKPVITRWGTWLEAALFYSQYYKEIQQVMHIWGDDVSSSIAESKKALNNPKLCQQLAYIKSNYSSVSETILKLEKQKVPLANAVQLVLDLKIKLESAGGNIGKLISTKFTEVLKKNEGFKTLIQVSNVLSGEFSDDLDLAPELISSLKFAPITSVDVERSFSAYKNILSDRRQSFHLENLEKHLVVAFNQNMLHRE